MIVENQFGADNVNPVADPKLPPLDEDETMKDADVKNEDEDADSETAKQERLEARRRAELERLHKIGIPVPGIHIKVDKMEATVWLENLEVECAHKAFADRVSRICDRAAEITAPLWQKR
jgi:cleavage and polyadenylation specificity factor subunit 3